MLPTPLRSCASFMSTAATQSSTPYITPNTSPLKKPVRRGSVDEDDEEDIRKIIPLALIDLEEQISNGTFDKKTPGPSKEASASPMRKPRRQKSKSFDTVSILNEALLLMDDLAVATSTLSVKSATQ